MIGWTSRTKTKKSSSSTKTKTNAYHSVEVKTSATACDAVKEIEGQRFLSTEAPPLPLAECNKYCKCRYVHFDDRRQGNRRGSFAADTTPVNEKGEKKNRRYGGDRRRRTR